MHFFLVNPTTIASFVFQVLGHADVLEDVFLVSIDLASLPQKKKDEENPNLLCLK